MEVDCWMDGCVYHVGGNLTDGVGSVGATVGNGLNAVWERLWSQDLGGLSARWGG